MDLSQEKDDSPVKRNDSFAVPLSTSFKGEHIKASSDLENLKEAKEANSMKNAFYRPA